MSGLSNSFKYKAFSLITILYCSIISVGQGTKIDSLNIQLKNSKHDTSRAGIYVSLSTNFYSEKPDTLVYLCNKALEIIDKNHSGANSSVEKSFLYTKATAFGNLSHYYREKGEYGKALTYLNQELEIWEKLNEKQRIASSLNVMGVIYYTIGKSKESLACYDRSLKIFEDEKMNLPATTVLVNLGYIYRQQGMLEEALIFFKKANVIFRDVGDKTGNARTLSELGSTYSSLNRLNDAREYCSMAAKIFEELGNKLGLAGVLTDIGEIKFKQNKIEEAISDYNTALDIYKNLGGNPSEINTSLKLGYALLKISRNKEAKKYAEDALRGAIDNQYPGRIRDAELLSCKVDSANKNHKGAFEHFKNYISYRDSLSQEETRKASIKSQLKYEYEKKEAVMIEQQEKEKVIAKEKNRRQQIIIGSVCVGLLIVVIFAVFVFRSLKTTRQQKIIIEEKQKDILDSIHYAKRIQQSLLPNDKFLVKTFDRISKPKHH